MSNPDAISSGDRVTITGNQCVEGTTTINGGLTITFGTMTGTIDSAYNWKAAMGMAFNSFSVTENSIYKPAAKHPYSKYLGVGGDHSNAIGNSLGQVVSWIAGLSQ